MLQKCSDGGKRATNKAYSEQKIINFIHSGLWLVYAFKQILGDCCLGGGMRSNECLLIQQL